MTNQNDQFKSETMLTVKDVAEILKLSETTILRWLRAEKFNGFFRIGRKWLIRKSDFEKFINQKVGEQT